MANYKFTPPSRRFKPIPIGSRFGSLTVIGDAEVHKRQHRIPCRCDCGNETTPFSFSLTSGKTRGCGKCDPVRTERARRMGHGNRRHGMAGKPEYNAWLKMRKRCSNPNDKAYRNYGARGIRVCPEWEANFEAFFAHVGPKPSPELSIDRIDNDRGYEPGNVRWADRSTQSRNRRPFTISPGSRLR